MTEKTAGRTGMGPPIKGGCAVTHIKSFSAEIEGDALSVKVSRQDDGKISFSWRRYNGSIRVDTSIKMSMEGAMATRDALTSLLAKLEAEK